MLEARPLIRIRFRGLAGMVRGQLLGTLDRMHNQLRHRIAVVPCRMVDFADRLRQLRVWHPRPVEIALKDNKNGIAVA